jgi:hypothetical protein
MVADPSWRVLAGSPGFLRRPEPTTKTQHNNIINLGYVALDQDSGPSETRLVADGRVQQEANPHRCLVCDPAGRHVSEDGSRVTGEQLVSRVALSVTPSGRRHLVPGLGVW